MEKRKPKVAWSHWDRILIGAIGLIVALSIIVALWFHQLDINPQVSVPTPTLPKPNAYDYYMAAGNSLIDHRKIIAAIYQHPSMASPSQPLPNISPSSGPGVVRPGSPRPVADHLFSYFLAQKAALVQENAQTLKLLHEGFAYPYQPPPIRSFDNKHWPENKIHPVVRLLRLKAQVETGRKEWSAAINSNIDIIQVGQEEAHGSPIAGADSGTIDQTIGSHDAWNCINHLTAVEAQAATRRLEYIQSRHVPWAETLQEEKWCKQASLLEVMHKPNWRGYIRDKWINYFGGEEWTWTERTKWTLTSKRAVMSNYTDSMNQRIANARRPYAAHPPDPPASSDIYSDYLTSNLSGLQFMDASCQTQNNLLLVALALHTYKAKQGNYPATLTALVPKYLRAVPDDVFALSGPLHYKRAGQKYVLYSIGPDGKDDGGKAIWNAWEQPPTTVGAGDPRYSVEENSVGDIVAGVNPQDAVDSPALRQRAKKLAAQGRPGGYPGSGGRR